MPQRIPIPFGRGLYEARSPDVSLESCLNLYLEQNPQGAKGPVTLYSTPGLTLWNTYGGGEIRGLHEFLGRMVVVSGDALYLVSSNGLAEQLVGNIEGSGPVTIIDNGIHLGIVTGDKAYAANSSDGIVELPEFKLNGATYQDGLGVFTQAKTQFFWLTDVDDMTTIGGLSFSSADTFSDNVVACISDHRDLHILKERSIELFANTGAAFAFSRTSPGIVERGCGAGKSVAKSNSVVYFLGDDWRFYGMQGLNYQPISTPGIDKIIAGLNDPGGCRAFVYQQSGHTFYVANFSDKTLVYDITTGAWHERKSDGVNRWRVNSHLFIWGDHYAGDFETGKIYKLDLDTYTDNGDTIEREIVSPPLVGGDGNRLSLSNLFIEMQTGVGITSGQGSDPQLMLSYTDDDGHSWSNELWRTAGAIGKRKTIAQWNRLGSFRERTFRLRITDPVPVAITSAYAQVERRAS